MIEPVWTPAELASARMALFERYHLSPFSFDVLLKGRAAQRLALLAGGRAWIKLREQDFVRA